ncbi:hypothetical protein NC315_13560 [Streptomyces sp. G2]|uniref:hypothetical protein n=1 Tax=Streptomyces sp. G2 TaxID=1684471 RepID=UPI00202E6E2C|nr:hypothetical protein [Streptomyces sp. G2]MCM1946397.1 hypothetical protein [Streptomyces sp. G2]
MAEKQARRKPRKPDAPLGAGALNPAELDERAEKIYGYHKKGHSILAIRRATGLSKEVVERSIDRARRNLPADTADDLRADRGAALQDMVREAHRNLAKAETVAERNACVRTIADLNMKLAKLLGLEVPAKVTLELEKTIGMQSLWGEETD